MKKSGSALGPGRASTSQALLAPTNMSQVELRHDGGEGGESQDVVEGGVAGFGQDSGGGGGRLVWRVAEGPHGRRQGFCLPSPSQAQKYINRHFGGGRF